MNEVDSLIVRAAARILLESGVRLRAEHDELADVKGLVGYRAEQVAQWLKEWLEEAEAAGVIPPLATR